MKIYIKLFIISALSILCLESNAQFLETAKPSTESGNTPFVDKLPAKSSKDRIKTRHGISTLPLPVIVSGLEVAYDQFSKNNVDYKLTLGYYTDKTPPSYNSINIDNYGSNSNALSYQGKLLDLEGYKAEIQIRKMLGTSNDDDDIGESNDSNLEYSFGVFAQIRNANARFIGQSSVYQTNTGSTVYTNIDRTVSASALFLGPVIMGNYKFNKIIYAQLALGTGPVISLGGNNIDSQMFDLGFRNPYQKAIGLKLNFAIGFYLD